MNHKRIKTIFSSLAFLTCSVSAMAQAVETTASIYIDANGSCMPWYFITSQGKRSTCGSDSNSEYSRGVCKDMKLEPGEYEFRYGGQHGVKVQIIGKNNYKVFGDQKGLQVTNTSGTQRLSFFVEQLSFEKNGFPGSFSVEGESLKWRQNRKDGPNSGAILNGCNQNFSARSTLPIMVDAPFLVTGEWKPNPYTHINGTKQFIIEDRNEGRELKFIWEGSYAYSPINNLSEEGENVFTITPNPNYWLNGNGVYRIGGVINSIPVGRSNELIGE